MGDESSGEMRRSHEGSSGCGFGNGDFQSQAQDPPPTVPLVVSKDATDSASGGSVSASDVSPSSIAMSLAKKKKQMNHAQNSVLVAPVSISSAHAFPNAPTSIPAPVPAPAPAPAPAPLPSSSLHMSFESAH